MSWERIEAWLKTNQPSFLETFNPPATPAQIEVLEIAIGVELPAALKELYLAHDGQNEGTFVGNRRLLSLREIEESWQSWTELLEGGDFDDREAETDGSVRPVWWDTKWIPFAENGAGDALCIDLNPIGSGKVGQIIEVWHADSDRSLIADNFEGWLVGVVDDLENGNITYEEDYGGFI